MFNKAIKGKFKPRNTKKYKGDTKRIVYRSMWERKFMVYCDRTKNVLEWSSEEIRIPYMFENKHRNYYPDFYVKFINTKDQIEECIVEIKPYHQRRWLQNKAKWESALIFCRDNNYTFKVLSERELF